MMCTAMKVAFSDRLFVAPFLQLAFNTAPVLAPTYKTKQTYFHRHTLGASVRSAVRAAVPRYKHCFPASESFTCDIQQVFDKQQTVHKKVKIKVIVLGYSDKHYF